jgi:hypothetical protein
MGWDFFRSYGARRAAGGSPFSAPVESELAAGPEEEASPPELDYELPESDWRPLESRSGSESQDWPHRPVRFVDGKDEGRTVAWLLSNDGYPVPVRLAQIGAVVMRLEDGRLQREWCTVERVVAMNTDQFGWEEIESLARSLREHNLRLLPAPVPHREGYAFIPYECEPWRHAAQHRSLTEMTRLERQALRGGSATPTLLDGRLEPRYLGFGLTDPVVGLIKTHAVPYLKTRRQWEVLYNLRPGQRTPAFLVNGRKLRVVSCYVRLADDDGGEALDSGIVRLELTHPFFKDVLQEDWDGLDRLAGLMTHYRCRDESYGRAAVSIHPIVRAEESLGSLFATAESLINRFYHLTRL